MYKYTYLFNSRKGTNRMKKTQNEGKELGSGELRRIEAKCARLRDVLAKPAWLTQGSVVKNGPTRWMWTRKVAGKTVTVAISLKQKSAFLAAIRANRQVELALAEIRRWSQHVLLTTLPNPPRKSPMKPGKSPLS